MAEQARDLVLPLLYSTLPFSLFHFLPLRPGSLIYPTPPLIPHPLRLSSFRHPPVHPIHPALLNGMGVDVDVAVNADVSTNPVPVPKAAVAENEVKDPAVTFRIRTGSSWLSVVVGVGVVVVVVVALGWPRVRFPPTTTGV